MKNPKTIEKKIKKLVPYWAKKLKLDKEIILKRDNRMWFWAAVQEYGGKYFVWYNSKRMAKDKATKNNLLWAIFHEFAHLKKKAFCHEIGHVKAEFIAESQALKWAKKYIPKYYKKHIKIMKKALKNPHYLKDHSFYKEAFSKIKDYQ